MPDMQLQGTGEEPLASLPLMPPRPPISYHKPDLDIITANDHVIQLIDPTASPYHVTARHLTHKEHRFVLNYTVVGVSTGWTVSVYDNSGLLVVEYTFALKLAALKFQEYITGYKPLACIEQTACSAIFEARLGKGQFKRPRYHGEGEIQLWCPEGLVDEAFISPPASLFRVSTSSTGVSARGSMFRTNGGPSKPNTPVVHHHRHRSPLLVAFLCGEGGYTMLRAKISDLRWHLTRNGDTDLLVFSSNINKDRGFKAFKHTTPTARIGEWDVGIMARNVGSRANKEITIVSLALKVKAVSGGSDETKDKLRYLQKQLDELSERYKRSEESQGRISTLINRGIDPAQGYEGYGGQVGTSPPASVASRAGTINGYYSPQELYAEYKRPQSAVYTQMEQTGALSPIQRPNSQASQPVKPEPQQLSPEVSQATIEQLPNEPQRTDPPEPPDSESSESSDEETCFTPLNQRIKASILAHPSLGPPTQTIKALHSLPGNHRAILYQFPTASPSESPSNLFRCPFNIINPHLHRKGPCKGPGFSLSELSDHLEDDHESFACHTCHTPFSSQPLLDNHLKTTCLPSSTPPNGVPFYSLNSVRRALKPPKKKEKATTEEERWLNMWDVLFPGVERPSPYFATSGVDETTAFKRVEVLFGAMIDADGGGGVVNKERAKLCLKVAMEALRDENGG